MSDERMDSGEPAPGGGGEERSTTRGHEGVGDHGPAWSASWARASESELEFWLAFALAASDEADRMALEAFRRDVEISTKPDRTFVTAADRAIERMIRERIAAAFPDHGVVGEEYGEEAGREAAGRATRQVRWYVDPIDGTHNFIRGIPLFGTLLALEVDGEIQVGVVSAPALQERWYARRGGGAWAVGAVGTDGPRRITTSRVERLDDALILYGSGRDIDASGRAPGFRHLLDQAWRERGFGDFWGYALVAEGAAEAMIEIDLHAWDIAAPLVVVEEAGGRITDLAGRRSVEGASVVASNGPLHETLLARLTRG